jgi:hypothetical protein
MRITGGEFGDLLRALKRRGARLSEDSVARRHQGDEQNSLMIKER